MGRKRKPIKRRKNRLATIAVLALIGAFALSYGTTFADDTVTSQAQEAGKDLGRGVKKGARSVKEKGCELVNGKMQCLGKKAKNRVKDGGEKVEDIFD